MLLRLEGMLQRTPSSLSKHVFEAQNGIVFFSQNYCEFALVTASKKHYSTGIEFTHKNFRGGGWGVGEDYFPLRAPVTPLY